VASALPPPARPDYSALFSFKIFRAIRPRSNSTNYLSPLNGLMGRERPGTSAPSSPHLSPTLRSHLPQQWSHFQLDSYDATACFFLPLRGARNVCARYHYSVITRPLILYSAGISNCSFAPDAQAALCFLYLSERKPRGGKKRRSTTTIHNDDPQRRSTSTSDSTYFSARGI
jgi:hypothetical protein